MEKKVQKNKIWQFVVLGVIVLFSIFVFMYIRQYTYNNGEITSVYETEEKVYLPVDNSTIITQSFSAEAEMFRAVVVEFIYDGEGLATGAVDVILQDLNTGEVLANQSLSSSFIASGEKALIGFPVAVVNDRENYQLTFSFAGFQEGINLQMVITSVDDPDGILTVNDIPIGQDIVMGVSAAGKDNSYVLIHVVYAVLILAIVLAYVMFFVIGKNIKTEFVYLVCGLLMGIAFSLVIPVMAAPDEPVHLFKAYDVSNKMLGEEMTGGATIMMRQSDYNKGFQLMDLDRSYMNYYLDGIMDKAQSDEMVATSYTPVFTYDYLYYPAALGMTIGRLMGLSTNMVYLLGRFFNTIIFVLAAFYAIRKIPFGKGVVFIWAMFPIMLQQTNSYSYDCMINGLSIVIIALTLNFMYGEKESKKSQIIKAIMLAFCCLLLFPCKSHALLPIVVLPLMILGRYLVQNRKTIWEKIKATPLWLKIVVGVGLLGFVGVCGLFALRIYANLTLPQNINNTIISWNGEAGYTIGYFLKAPFELVSVFINTIWMKSNDYLIGLFGGNLGWLDIPIPHIFVIPFGVLIVLAAFRKENEEQLIKMGSRLWMWLMFAGVCFIAMLGMLINWTPASYNYIEGVQGRYFLPGLVLLYIGFRTKKACIGKDTDKVLMFLSVFMNLFIVTAVFKNIL